MRKRGLKSDRVETDPHGSKHKGFWGAYETLFRRFKTFMFLVTLAPLYMLGGLFIGLALFPPVILMNWTLHTFRDQAWWEYSMAVAMAIGFGWFLFGFSLILIVPAANFLMRTKPKIFRGPYYSVDFLRWFVHNCLTYVVRYTFLEFITPTPFNILFFQLMGMKIGRGSTINTSNISDPALIEIGERVTLGGSVTLVAHYGQGGFLVLAPIKIGNNVTVGLKASIMGGVEIGDNAKIMPHSIVLPKTKIPPGELWGGVPAQKVSLRKLAA